MNLSATEIENMLTESVKLERMVLGVDTDRSKYAQIRIFIGQHHYENEPGYGQPQEYTELLPPNNYEDGGDDGHDDVSDVP